MLTPSAVSTSAEPDFDDKARLPCLATGTPQPATTSALAVEMLKLPDASPPVPQVSIVPGGASIVTAFARMIRAAPGDLVDGLAAHPQRHQKGAHLRRGGVAAHDDVERRLGLVLAEAAALCHQRQQRFEIRGGAVHAAASGIAERRNASVRAVSIRVGRRRALLLIASLYQHAPPDGTPCPGAQSTRRSLLGWDAAAVAALC